MASVLTLAVVASGCGGDNDDGSETTGTAQTQAGTPTPAAEKGQLVGTWRSGSTPMGRIRSVLRSDGFTEAEIDGFLRQFELENAGALVSELSFYRETGEPFWAHRFWVPADGRPADADHGPYEQLGGERVALTSADPQQNKYRYVFGYKVEGDELELEVVSLINPGLSKAQFRLEEPLFHALAAAPLRR